MGPCINGDTSTSTRDCRDESVAALVHPPNGVLASTRGGVRSTESTTSKAINGAKSEKSVFLAPSTAVSNDVATAKNLGIPNGHATDLEHRKSQVQVKS